MDIRLIVSDLDGTLLGRDKKISPRTAAALHRAREMGVQIALASGRRFSAIVELARDAALDDCIIISTNGSRIDLSTEGRCVYSRLIPEQTASEAVRRLIGNGCYAECYTDGVIYRMNPRIVSGHFRTDGLSADGTLFTTDRERLLQEGCAACRKLIVFSDDETELENARRVLSDLPLSFSSSNRDNLEIMAPNAGKGAAVSWIAADRGISREQIMAFGDQTNDLPLFDEAGWPVAMDNAVEELKSRARLIAPRFDEDGVARIIEEYVLKGETE